MQEMTYGVIDVGSNTIRLVIYEVKENRIESLFSNKNTAGLIGYVNDGELSRKGIRKACDVLNSLQKVAAHAQVEKLYVFATASLRNIANTKEAVEEIEKETGLDIDVISGHDEAELDFEGAAHAQKLKDGIMVDIGGGSTEVVAFVDGKITDAVSLEFGSLSMYKTYVSRLFPKNSEERAIRKKVENEIKKVKFLKKKQFADMVGIGGTIRAVKKFNNDRFGLPKENDRILMDQMHLLLEDLQEEEKLTLNMILRVAPDRVHTMVPGMIILDTLCDYFSCEEIRMSNFGVREGYLYKKVVMGK